MRAAQSKLLRTLSECHKSEWARNSRRTQGNLQRGDILRSRCPDTLENWMLIMAPFTHLALTASFACLVRPIGVCRARFGLCNRVCEMWWLVAATLKAG